MRRFREREAKRARVLAYVKRKPVRVGEEIEVLVEGIGPQGDGFARIKNFIIFIPGAQQGSRLRVRVTRVGAKFARAEVVEKKES